LKMLFCPKCGSIMSSKEQKGKKQAVCVCGYIGKEPISRLKEKIKQKSQDVHVLSKEAETLPVTDAECPKCSHKQAYYWTMQTRAADEGETKFLKCKSCNHTWRDYG